jgi:hypothetical protein
VEANEQAGLSFALKLTAAGVRAIAIDDRSASDAMREGSGGRVQVAAPDSEIVQRTIAEVPAAEPASPSAPPRRHETGASRRIASAGSWRNT